MSVLNISHVYFLPWQTFSFLTTFLLWQRIHTAWIRSFFRSVLSCIRSEYRKIRTRRNSVFEHFSRSDNLSDAHWGKWGNIFMFFTVVYFSTNQLNVLNLNNTIFISNPRQQVIYNSLLFRNLSSCVLLLLVHVSQVDITETCLERCQNLWWGFFTDF